MSNERTYIILDRIELKNMNDFAKEHEHSNIFLLETSDESGIGTNIFITCDKCGMEGDLTNYEVW